MGRFRFSYLDLLQTSKSFHSRVILDLLRLTCINQSMPWPRGFHQWPLNKRLQTTRDLGLSAIWLLMERLCTRKHIHTQTPKQIQQTFVEANTPQIVRLMCSPAVHVALESVCDLSQKGGRIEYVNTCMKELFIVFCHRVEQ